MLASRALLGRSGHSASPQPLARKHAAHSAAPNPGSSSALCGFPGLGCCLLSVGVPDSDRGFEQVLGGWEISSAPTGLGFPYQAQASCSGQIFRPPAVPTAASATHSGVAFSSVQMSLVRRLCGPDRMRALFLSDPPSSYQRLGGDCSVMIQDSACLISSFRAVEPL